MWTTIATIAVAPDTLRGPAILPGNQIMALQNGDEIFAAMLNAIRAAKYTTLCSTG
jgi:cardiolipin synthase